MLLSPTYAEIVDTNFGLSAWVGGECIAASGCVPVFPHRAVGWAVVSDKASPHMLALVRKFRRVLSNLDYQRIEASVRSDFNHGHRFAKLIGLQLETPEPLRKYGANGEDEMIYAMVR